MQVFFAPAISLMNRLRYNSKFLLLGVAMGIVMLLLLFTVFVNLNRDIQTASNELDGLQVLKPVNKMAQFMQQHRGLSSGVLNGNDAMKDKRAAKEKEVSDIVSASEAMLSPKLRDSAIWKKIRQDWEEIRVQGLSWTPPENFKRHTVMIRNVLVLMVDIADDSELTLDPVIDTYYFMDTVVSKMPAMLEPLGITRGRGTGVLTKKELTPQMRIDIATVIAQMDSTLSAQNENIAKVVRFAPSLQAGLSGPAKEFSDGAENIFALVRNDILGEKFATDPKDYFAQTTQVIDLGYKVMFEVLIPQFEQQLKERMAEARNALIFNVGIALFVMVLVGYLAFGTYYSVINSVTVFSQGARRLADGDLTVQFSTAGHDELHMAGNDFNDMATAFRTLLGRIQSDVQQLRGAAEQLATSSQQISSGTEAQSDSASTMAAAVEQMTVGVDHIAKNAQEAQGYSRESDDVARQGSSIVEDVVKEIQGIANTVNQSAAAVEALGKHSDQISAIVGTINLLALNAAIEAARAGESGRGFAVVADEVRKLAERTAKSTQEIAGMIGAIQSGTATAVSSMKMGVERVANGVEQAEKAGGAIAQVQAQSRQVRNAVDEISTALREQSAASTEIAQNVERIAQMAEENNVAACNNTETAGRLRHLAETLSTAVSRFRT
jgi:methyl-accepting chemotaxis protein